MLASLLLACSKPPKADAQTAAHADESWLPPVPTADRQADDAARFLAGMPGKPGSPFAELEQSEAWISHQRELDRTWAAIEDKTIRAMRDFQKSELSSAAVENSPVFYPFSGPDALIMGVFFPHNPVYVMVGLEPPGTLPTPKHFPETELKKKLAESRDTTYSILHRSFFITRQMDRQFRGQVTDGLFPPILTLLVRSNTTIVGYRYIRIDDSGKLVDRPGTEKTPNRGVEIDFTRGEGQPVQRLFYFSVNLSDKGLRDNKGFAALAHNLKGCSTFFKATSYMTHHSDFSIIRSQVLENSARVLQDDSGIPYRFFTGNWKVQLFGAYERPYGSFRYLEQKDLRRAYAAPDVKPLAFKIGYGFSRIPSNLQLAQQPVQ